MKKIFLIFCIVLFVATVIFVSVVNFLPKKQNNNGNVVEKKGIVVLAPKENKLVSSPLKIEGYVNGDGWIGFEGQVGTVKLFDDKDKELGTSILTAKGEWMSRSQDDRGSSIESGQVKIDFETTLWFDYPGDGMGKLVFYNENPSGEAERNKTFMLPVKLTKSSSARTNIKVYFNGPSADAVVPCEQVAAVEREIPKTHAVAKATIEELLKGPSDLEKKVSFKTSINPSVKVQSLVIEGGVAKIDFNEELQKGVAGSCRVTAIRAQITETLKQFPTVTNVVISIDGRTEDILQP